MTDNNRLELVLEDGALVTLRHVLHSERLDELLLHPREELSDLERAAAAELLADERLEGLEIEAGLRAVVFVVDERGRDENALVGRLGHHRVVRRRVWLVRVRKEEQAARVVVDIRERRAELGKPRAGLAGVLLEDLERLFGRRPSISI